ncbi:hypothetical protein LPB136_07515 [Tenacibaculum todarodis]|uniref:Tetratricopeptide repeat protein n=1 Tax=Tenacibaculum todarodis TaxID=1850252 RepID=A0A1L3JJ84_9FLAO|nr:hypothetical protein [Tenacibaculum todarodis]APG65201.1 hypothetical protein LPB136_07515 [Tenacibaculum todarodis]
MNKDKYIQILSNPHLIQQEETTELKKVIDEFPYFQSARSLYLKALNNHKSFKYNNELKITAAYTTDRTVLFDFITSTIFEEEEKSTKEAILHQQLAEEIPQEVLNIEEELSIGKPFSFTQNESHSFNQWLQLSVKKPIIRTPEKPKTEDKISIIEKFIQNSPKISRVKKGTISEIKVDKNEQPSLLMTETLAKVYLEQKKYGNAIKAYEILSLKYPEKSGFFADQIKRIQILQNSK